MIVTVECLIKCQQPSTVSDRGYKVGDIITIQPSGHQWGIGDLLGKTIVCMDLDLPCGEDFMVRKRCLRCDYHGIEWGKTELKTGDIGYPKIECPKERWCQPDVIFEFELTPQGIPAINHTLRMKRRAMVDIVSILSTETLSKIQSEKLLSNATKDERLLRARKVKLSNTICIEKDAK